MINNLKKINTINIKIKSFSYNIIQFYIASFFTLIDSKKINLKMQPIKYKKLTLLRSPHKYKKAQEHFQLKIYKALLVIHDVDVSQLALLLTNKPQGVYINIKVKQNFK